MGSFQDNKSLFIGPFPQFADPFASEWAATTATARLNLPDYVSVTDQSSETDTLETLMDEGRNLFQTVILYVQLAFPNDPNKLKLFGQSQYNPARASQLKLPVLLRTMYTQASKPEYKTALITKGLTESQINMLETLATSIVNQNIVQEKVKNERSLSASDRIAAMNAVWEKMSLVCMCAKMVFQTDAAKYNLFLLTDGEAPNTNDTPPQTD
ncbi:MAG: hypothetical protein Q8R96_03885 [Bacteroidota bacterium]|nr:hypothetical protein [Bacteroidota bacterium]